MLINRAVFLSLGSNIEPLTHMLQCLKLLAKSFPVEKISSIYETTPHGPAGKENFLNAVVLIRTSLQNDILQNELRNLEASLGRLRNSDNKVAPRTIDIDILPYPGFQNQPFIMIPLAEIAPGEIDPDTGRTFRQIASEFTEEIKTYRKVVVPN